MKITVAADVEAPMARVWEAYVTPDDIMQWNAASDDWHTTRSTVDFREGGTFNSRMEAKDGSFGFDFEGTYTRIEPYSLIEYSMGDRAATVQFAEADIGNAVTVSVTFDAEGENDPDMQRAGWQAILDNFKRHVEASE